jgi:hypothetical protein
MCLKQTQYAVSFIGLPLVPLHRGFDGLAEQHC